MEGNNENPIEISSSPVTSPTATPVKMLRDTAEESPFPSRPPSACSSGKSSTEKTPPVRHISDRGIVGTGELFHDNASTCSSTSSTTTSAPSVNKRFPNRSGIVWRKGEKIEAMDFIAKWYPAKIMEIDEDDLAVLVHFEGWNQRYDQWMDMSSEKIRPKARHSGRKEKKKSLNAEYKVGDHVYARWTDCKMYPARISALHSDDSFEVIFYDGYKKNVQGINIKPMPPEVKQQKIEIVHVLPKDTRKRPSTEGLEAEPMTSEVTAASIVPEKTEETKPKKPKTEKNPESRKKAMARKRQRMLIAGSLFVSHSRPRSKKKKPVTKVPSDQPLSLDTPISSPSIPQISSTPSIPGASTTQNAILPVSASDSASFPSTPLMVSPVTSVSGEKRKKRLMSPAISETSSESQSEDQAARIRRRSRSSVVEDRAAVQYTPPTLGPLLPPKGFVVEKDHNHFKCMFEGCNKAFRKETLLESHIKYYHVDNERGPGMVRKRRKTSSICSTDSDASQVDIKKRHMSADSALHSMNQQDSMELDVDEAPRPEPRDLSAVEAEQTQEVVETMATEEEGEEEVLLVEEVVNCVCMLNEENGLMIQCEVCLCWQHAICFDLTGATLPRKYICFVCLDPPAVRDSCRYIYEQDWLKTGELYNFSFLPHQQRDENKNRTFLATNCLVSDTANVDSVLHGLKRKIIALDDKNHPEYKLWKKNWDEEPEDIPDDHHSEEGHMTGEGSENLDLLESAAKMNSELNKASGKGDTAVDDVEIYKAGVEKKEDENLIHDSLDHGIQSEEDAGKDSSGESSVNADSESTLSAPEAIAHQNMQDHEASMAEEALRGEVIVEEIKNEEMEDNIDTEQEDPYVNCEKNLLHHIIKVQSTLDERLDMIEEQVAALEGAETDDEQANILSDIPSIKKSLHMLQNDLIKISRMAAYHR